MTLRLAIIGVDPIQRDWTEAVRILRERNILDVVAVGHRAAAPAKDLADLFGVTAYDDLRRLLLEAAPQVILLDRPATLTLDFLTTCLQEKIGFFSLGPPVFSVAEALTLADILEPRTAQLYTWPRLAASPAYRHCAQADQFVRPIRFIAAHFYALNHSLAKNLNQSADTVRSLSVLAWDALATLIDLMGLPESVYALLHGTAGSAGNFADLSGVAALTLRFSEQGVASLALSDRLGPPRRELLVLGQSGTLHLRQNHYDFTDAQGQLIDSGDSPPVDAITRAVTELHEFLNHFSAQPSPHRGWEHHLPEIAATMEAMQVSHRTGQAEIPERFLTLRR